MGNINLKKGIVFLFVLFAAVFMCGNTCEAAKISKKKATIYVGETVKLKVTGTSKSVKWSTSKKKTATVNKNGVVTGKKIGKCTITAKVSGKKYKCSVTVKKLPKDYATVNGVRVKVGKTIKLTSKIQSNTPVAFIDMRYQYNHDALSLVEEKFKIWWPEKGDVDYNQLYSWEPDMSNYKAISCKKAKTVSVLKIKINQSGNYTWKNKITPYDINLGTIKKYKVTETIK